jgi:hypothetical protein
LADELEKSRTKWIGILLFLIMSKHDLFSSQVKTYKLVFSDSRVSPEKFDPGFDQAEQACGCAKGHDLLSISRTTALLCLFSDDF